MNSHQPITVVGAGLSGLMFARVLHVNGIATTVLDLDASPTVRGQGGMLDIHEESGQAALRAAGLYEQFRTLIHPGSEAMRILDKDAEVHMADDGDKGNRPEVSRRDLRDLLLGSLPEGTVRWGAKVSGAHPLGDGRHQVLLADGGSFTTDLLVGADGAWSRVRGLVSDATPAYTGISFFEANFLDADSRHPDHAATVGNGMLFALGEDKGFLAHREGDGSLHIYIALRVAADFADTVATQAILLDQFEGWDKRLRALITDGDGALVPRQVHALPVGHRWQRTPGVTLLGDAAHLMSPFAGEGANLAMIDGADLAAAIVAHPGDTETALAAYEETMFPRGKEAAEQSAAGLEICFSPDAPKGLLDMMSQHG